MNAPTLVPAHARRYRIRRRASEAIKPCSPRAIRRDCHGRLLAALLEMAGAGWEVADSGLTPWASATFVGARHSVHLVARGEATTRSVAAFADGLPEAEFSIAGHIVIDVVVDALLAEEDGVRVELSVLTVEAW